MDERPAGHELALHPQSGAQRVYPKSGETDPLRTDVAVRSGSGRVEHHLTNRHRFFGVRQEVRQSVNHHF